MRRTAHTVEKTNKMRHVTTNNKAGYSVSDIDVSSNESGELSLSSEERGFLASGAAPSSSAGSQFSAPDEGSPPWSIVSCFLRFILRFWNQVLTCVSLRSRDEASSILSGTERYFFSANFDSRPSSCISVKTVRSFLFLLGRLLRLERWWWWLQSRLASVCVEEREGGNNIHASCIYVGGYS